MIKQMLRKLFEYQKRRLGLNDINERIEQISQRQMSQFNSLNQIQQLQLAFQYRNLAHSKSPQELPSLHNVEFRVFSQNGEDGILHYIFSLIGTTNKRCVEICAGDGIECNTANLIVNHGWHGLLFDGQEALLDRGRKFYAQCKETQIWPPKLVSAWITVENVNELIASHGFTGEIDLLSLDMDGMDWWIWKAIETIMPRVVVVEVANWFPPTQAVTVPYRPDFQAIYDKNYGLFYGGASLGAFVALAKKKGYRLIGCHRYAFNIFFMRDNVGQDLFPEISPEECHHMLTMFIDTKDALARAKEQEWVDVANLLE